MASLTNKLSLYLPTYYWLKRYAGDGIAVLLFRLGLLELMGLVVLVADGVTNLKLLGFYLYGTLSYIAAYEVGYWVNDTYARVKEGQPQKLNVSGHDLKRAIFIRAVFVSLLILVGARLFGGGAAVALLAAIALSQCLFYVHNMIVFPGRVFTFFGLYLVRFIPLLYLVFAYGVHLWSVLFLCLAVSASYTMKYYYDRTEFVPDLFRYGVLSVRLQFFTYRVVAVLFFLGVCVSILVSGPSWILVSVLVYVVLVDGVLVLLYFVKALRGGLFDRTNLYHLHTDLSHDSDLKLERHVECLRRLGMSKAFLTDHAEDVSEGQYNDLCVRSADLSIDGVELVPGLEYDVCGQHVLFLNMKKRLNVERYGLDSFTHYIGQFDRAIWAHPHFKIKALLSDSSYRRSLRLLLRRVDAVEFVNLKSTRGWHYAWRHLLIGLLGVFLHGKRLSVGVDAHSDKHLNQLVVGYPYRNVKSYLVSLFSVRIIDK